MHSATWTYGILVATHIADCAMTKIRTGEQVAEHLPQLRDWYEAQWGKIDSFAGNHPEIEVPEPLLAFGADAQLQGGLVFSTFQSPHSDQVEVWINAVFVDPLYRGQHIGSALISLAENSARQQRIDSLFVFTQIPSLYTNLGWQLVEQTNADCVLSKKLAGSATLGAQS